MNQLTDRREFLRQTSAASLACLGAIVPAAVARAAEAAGGQRLRAGTARWTSRRRSSRCWSAGAF